MIINTDPQSVTNRNSNVTSETSAPAPLTTSGQDIVSIFDIVTMCGSMETIITFLQENKLLKESLECDKCNVEMIFRKRTTTSDGYTWACNKCKKTKTIRDGSFFHKCRLNMKEILVIMYVWAVGVQGFTVSKMIPRVPRNTVYDYFSFCRDITIEKIRRCPVMFDDSSTMEIELQIDESVLGKKCKYNRGRPFKNYWLFGISDPKNHKCFLVMVPNRTKETLLSIIETHVPKSANIKIISDGWASYESLTQLAYKHSTVVHKTEFLNSLGEHTNSIESVWSQLKNWFRGMHGVDPKY